MKRQNHKIRVMSNFIKKENKGAALVMVIIAMAFIGVLVSVICYTSVYNYHMKVNNYKATDSFYNAETVLDEICAGMEQMVSASVATHYMEVLQSFSIGTSEDKNETISKGLIRDVVDAYKYNEDIDRFDLDILKSYIRTTSGTYLLEAGDDPLTKDVCGVMEHYTDGIVFRGLRVTYTDAAGYVSIIETDIKIKCPVFDFVNTANLPSLSDYSVIAKECLSTANVGENRVSGSFYAGSIMIGNETDPAGATLTLKEDGACIIADKRMVVAGDINMAQNATLTSDHYGELWAQNIHLVGKDNVHFAGCDVYLADDIMITGKENSFTAGAVVENKYSGKFVGYGDGNSEAYNEEATKEAGSAIIVNGTDTTLDFASVTAFTLAGNGYIELYNPANPLEANQRNPVMGQSIAVKSDQLAYLVPAECIAVGEGGVSELDSPTNPITLETYNEVFKENADPPAEVNVYVPVAALGGKTLYDYGIGEGDIQRVFRQISGGTTLCYFYISFDSNNQQAMINAERYFRAVYNANKVKMDAYQNLYTKSVVLRNPQTSFYTLHMAGNAVCKRFVGEADYQLQEATLSFDRTNSGYQSDLVGYENKADALKLKLVDVLGQLTPAEQEVDANGVYKKTAYDNLVDTALVDEFSIDAGAQESLTGGDVNLFDGGDVMAYVINGDYTHANGAAAKGIIIATGDVSMRRDFEGLVISGGEVKLDNGVSLRPNPEAMQKALTLSQNVNGKKYRVAEFLLGGEGYLNTANTMYANNRVAVEDLIVYENWEKK